MPAQILNWLSSRESLTPFAISATHSWFKVASEQELYFFKKINSVFLKGIRDEISILNGIPKK